MSAALQPGAVTDHSGGPRTELRTCVLNPSLPVLRRRKSTFLYGIEDDAREVIDELAVSLAEGS